MVSLSTLVVATFAVIATFLLPEPPTVIARCFCELLALTITPLTSSVFSDRSTVPNPVVKAPMETVDELPSPEADKSGRSLWLLSCPVVVLLALPRPLAVTSALSIKASVLPYSTAVDTARAPAPPSIPIPRAPLPTRFTLSALASTTTLFQASTLASSAMRALTLPSITPVPMEGAKAICLEAATPASIVSSQLRRWASTKTFCAFRVVLPGLPLLPRISAVTSESTRLVAVATPKAEPCAEPAPIQAVATLSV